MPAAGGTYRDRPQFYGRRHGHKLRPARRKLVRDLLPLVRVAVPEDAAEIDLKELFGGPKDDIRLELGFGAGEHLAAQAMKNPGVGFIGCEPFVNGVAACLAAIEKDSLSNVRLFDDDARLLFPALPDRCLGRVYVLFSDPWPKKRHHRRRLIGGQTLDQLARLMKAGAELIFASDHMDYVAWTLGRFRRHPAFAWTARRPRDWRHPPEAWAATRYEAKALKSGAAPAYLVFKRLP